ncbi:hypothetical protein LX32DRAFT_322951 [Colletotrichum zoysiae]|uniref:Uncharacterized protein n=1 Tax=Colletotrichum zoysiae TaxID=1216348 RepID=A0AAD9LW28_9PEZI|nr:hypothetical protein LX32DRAFT_322951 [Colletotrichum zoysiae]
MRRTNTCSAPAGFTLVLGCWRGSVSSHLGPSCGPVPVAVTRYGINAQQRYYLPPVGQHSTAQHRAGARAQGSSAAAPSHPAPAPIENHLTYLLQKQCSANKARKAVGRSVGGKR